MKIISEKIFDMEAPSFLAEVDGFLIAVSEISGKVAKIAFDGKLIWESSGGLKYPTAAVPYGENMLLVSDRWNGRIVLYDRFTGEESGSFGKESGLVEPWGVALFGGYILVADKYNGKIFVFDSRFELVKKFGKRGVVKSFYESGRFKRGVHFNNWISRASALYRVEPLFYSSGYEVGEFEYPEHIVSFGGNIYISDKSAESIAVYDNAFSLSRIISLPLIPTAFSTFGGGILACDEIARKVYCGGNLYETDIFPSYVTFISAMGAFLACDTFAGVIFKLTFPDC